MQKLTKPSDIKRTEPIDKTKKSHHKKEYPPHWQLRSGGWLWPSKNLKKDLSWRLDKGTIQGKIKIYKNSKDMDKINEFIKNDQLDEALAIYAKHHPETKNWPIRFINIQPIPTTREVIL